MTGRDEHPARTHEPNAAQAECAFARDNAAAHALGALDFEDHARIDRHLISCPMCAKVLADLTRIVEFLPFASKPLSPSPRVKTALMARMQNESAANQHRVRTDADGRSLTIPASTSAAMSASATAPRALKPKRANAWSLLAAPLATIPLVVAIVIVGGWALSMRADNIDKSRQIALLSTANGNVNARQYRMTPAASTTDNRAGGFVLFSPGSRTMTVVLSGITVGTTFHVVAEASDGQRYQCGEIEVDETGNGATMIALEHPVENLYMVHIQPVESADGAVNDSVARESLFFAVVNDDTE